ncbi:MAG TPA: integrase core domain-containing protein [Herpetosiphonaceae bacterium]
MEEQWIADRAALRAVLRTHPAWTQTRLAQHLGRSVSWVKKWRRRLRAASPDDPRVLWSRPRARHTPPPQTHPLVIERLLALRDELPATLHRTPGPRTLQYYLAHDPELIARGLRPPRSTRTIWRILRKYGRSGPPVPRPKDPLERPPPLTAWQLDFKDASTVPADPDGKRQHVVEVLNTVDSGTSILLDAQVRGDFVSETALEAVVQTVEHYGLPQQVTFDRDPRCAQRAPGSAAQRDFPSAFVRFWLCLGVQVDVCLPHHPQHNGFVERYHRTFKEECLRVYQPRTEDQVRVITRHFQRFYNEERPHQGLSCRNQPPRTAFPVLPTLPAVPPEVDPDQWLTTLHGQCYTRKVRQGGSVTVADTDYYIRHALRGQYVTLQIDAEAREFVVYHQQQAVKRLPIKGLVGQRISFGTFVEHLVRDARREQRQRWHQQRRAPAGM